MAYDADLADRLREQVYGRLAPTGVAVTEKKMFGGLAFLVGGHLAVAASGQGGLLVRTDPEEGADLLAAGLAEPMQMRGRTLTGWLRVGADAVRDDDALAAWVQRGVTFTLGLPAR